MSSFAPAFQELQKVEGVKGVLIVDSKGSLIEKVSLSQYDEDSLIELTNACFFATDSASHFLNKGNIEQNYVEYKGLSITLDLLPGDLRLVVIALGKNLGRIRFEIKRSKKLLENDFYHSS